MTDAASNRLPILAAEIRAAHNGVLDAAKTAAERAIEAGHALAEAKALVKHGEWLPWLKEHCQLSERTAQLYMKIAGSGLESATVADLGLRAASKADYVVRDPSYTPFANCDEAGEREWLIFTLFLVRKFGASVEGASRHVEYVLQKQFATVEEWLGPEGIKWRRTCFFPVTEPAASFMEDWVGFLAEHKASERGIIEAELEAELARQPERPTPRKRRRARP